jgi:predicted ferric reductase
MDSKPTMVLQSLEGLRARYRRPANEVSTVRPQNKTRRRLRAVAAGVLGLIFFGIAAVIVGLWLQKGGITGIRGVGDLLTSAGRIAGLFGTYLLLVQLLLLARIPFLEWTVGFDRLTLWHRRNGKICLYLILGHVGFIVAGYAMNGHASFLGELSMMLSTYPGMLAALVGTVMLILVAVTSVIIVRRRMRYESWYLVHLMAYIGVAMAWTHQTPTGNIFIANPMAVAFWTALYVATLQLVILFRLVQPVVRALWHGMRVAEVSPEGPGVVSLRITGRHLDWLNVRAGQFFLWRFLTREHWSESHPFSLSAAPDGQSFRVTIKSLGDFSGDMAQIRPGTRVMAEGPFGSFTEDARTRKRVVLIAGGVGITPIRALLERMHGDLILIYRATREEDILFRDELTRLAHDRGVTIHYVVGDRKQPENAHFLSAAHVRQLVPNIASREVFLCGPEAMMRTVEKVVRHLGVPPRYIHRDQFAM